MRRQVVWVFLLLFLVGSFMWSSRFSRAQVAQGSQRSAESVLPASKIHDLSSVEEAAETSDNPLLRHFRYTPFEWVIGDKSAPVSMVVYLSPTCDNCAKFYRETIRILMRYTQASKLMIKLRLYGQDALSTRLICLFFSKALHQGGFDQDIIKNCFDIIMDEKTRRAFMAVSDQEEITARYFAEQWATHPNTSHMNVESIHATCQDNNLRDVIRYQLDFGVEAVPLIIVSYRGYTSTAQPDTPSVIEVLNKLVQQGSVAKTRDAELSDRSEDQKSESPYGEDISHVEDLYFTTS